LGQRSRRLDADLVAQNGPIRLILAQRLGRSPGLVQRPQQQRLRPVPIGVFVEQRQEFDHRSSIFACVEQDDDQLFHRSGVQLAEPPNFALYPWLIRELVVGEAAP